MHGLFRWSSKWWPGVIPLVAFWVIAAWTSTEPMEADLARRSLAALKGSVLDKTQITVAGRDVSLSAEAFSEDGRKGALAAVGAVPGVRLVNDETRLVPEAKPFVWSGTDLPDTPSRGVNPGTEDNYSPNNSSTQVFDAGFLKVDSGTGGTAGTEQPANAFDVAQKHGGSTVLKKAPDTPVFYVLDWSHANNQLIWHVIYGSNRDEAKLAVAVNASTGDFIRVEK